MGKSEKQKNSYLTAEMIRMITQRGYSYSQYQNQALKVVDELNAVINEYLEKQNLWKDKNAIQSILYRLPYIYPREYLYDAIYAIEKEYGEMQTDMREYILPPEMLMAISTMGKKYTQNRMKASKAENRLRKRINNYMTEHDLWKNQDAILEIIGLLPSGYLRFNLYGTYHELDNEKRG